MIYGVTKLDDGTYLITGSPDTTRYVTLQDAMRAAGRLNARELDKSRAAPRSRQLQFTSDDGSLRKIHRSKRSA